MVHWNFPVAHFFPDLARSEQHRAHSRLTARRSIHMNQCQRHPRLPGQPRTGPSARHDDLSAWAHAIPAGPGAGRASVTEARVRVARGGGKPGGRAGAGPA